MAVPVMVTSPSGEVDFSLEFEDAVFCIVPSSIVVAFVVTNIVHLLVKRSRNQKLSLRKAPTVDIALLLVLLALHLASTVIFSRLPELSELRTRFTHVAYAFRLVSALALVAAHLLLRRGAALFIGLYFLITFVLDGIRAHSLWVVSLKGSQHNTQIALAALQSAIAAVSIIFVANESIAASSLASRPARIQGFKVNEQSSSSISRLAFGWLWYLLSYGRKNKICDEDLAHIVYHPAATYKFDQISKASDQSTRAEFIFELSCRYFASSSLALLAAGATLAQPLIIQGIVKYLQGSSHYSVGVWLVIAMFLDQLAIALLSAHSDQCLTQMSYRLRAFLIEKVLARSLSSTPPMAGWTDAGSKTVVYLSTDIPTITHGITISNDILSSMVIVGVGSFLLFRLINLALLGPLLVALASTFVPTALGKPLARSQRLSLEATERRVEAMKSLVSETRAIRIGGAQNTAADLVSQNRKVEIEATCAYRRVITFVAVAATSVNGVAVLAAFGGFSLIDRLAIDYSILFTALATMQIMLTPLLSLVQMLPVFISSFVSIKRLRNYLRQSNSGGDSKILYSENGPLLSIKHADIGWEIEKPILSDFNLDLVAGDVVSVSGQASTGKSTMFSAVLEEAKVLSGEVILGTRHVAYCSQKTCFIAGLSIRDTITLGKEFSETLYNEVVRCCCLDVDFRILHLGDGALLDNSGAPLSGGQQKRVALARALYHEPELLLLDEVFTGLDVTTRRSVVENMFGLDGFVQKRSKMGVLIVSTEVLPLSSRYANVKTMSLNSGQLTQVELAAVAVPENSANAEIAIQNETGTEDEAQLFASANLPAKNLAVAVPPESGESSIAMHDEDTKGPSPYRKYFKSFGSPLSTCIIFGSVMVPVAIDRASVFWLSKWTSTYDDRNSNINDGYYVGVYASFVVAGSISMFFSVWALFMEAIPDSGLSLHSDMLKTLLRTPALVIEETKPEIINRFTQDIDAVDLALPQALQNLMFAIGSGIASLVVIGIGSPYTLILVAVLLPMLYFLQKHYLATSAQLRKLQVSAQAPILSCVSAAIESRLVLRAMRKEGYITDTLSERVYAGLRPGYLFSSIQKWMLLVLKLVNASVLTVLAALLVGLRGRGNVGWAGLALLNAVTLSQDAILFMTWWTSFENHMASMERILEYTTNTPVESVGDPDSRPDDSWPSEGRVTLQNLSLSYGTHEAVRGVDIDVAPGSKVAVIGRTGSGKTSLMQCFFGLIDISSGNVSIDGIDVDTVQGETVRQKIVGHPQVTFSNGTATVRKNLDALGRCSDEEIQRALSRVAVDLTMCNDIMSRLDSRWDECNFSSGWQQRLGLVRIILRKSRVYVLDEPTSGMDEESHELVMNELFGALESETVFVVTHLLLGIEKFDIVLVLADGELVESGSPNELLTDPDTRLSGFAQARKYDEK